MHALPLAAWAALAGLIGGAAAPADWADAPCEAPDCYAVSHGFLMNPIVLVAGSGSAVEWRSTGGSHWMVEGATSGGCLSFDLSSDKTHARVHFILENERLYAAHRLPDGTVDVLPCTSATILPNGMAALRYGCAIHAREGGFGLILVSPDPESVAWDFLA